MFGIHRAHRLLSKGIRNLRSGAVLLFCMTLAFLPMIYFGGEAWWLPLALGIVLACNALWMIRAWWLGGSTAKIEWHGEYLLFLFPIAWCLLQIIPFGSLLPYIAPNNAAIKEQFNSIGIAEAKSTISMSVDATRRQLYTWSIGLLCFFITVNRVRDNKTLRWIMASIFTAAFCNTILSFLQLKGHHVQPAIEILKGTFINRNHFAFFLNMGIFCGAGLFFSTRAEIEENSKNSRWPRPRLRWEIPLSFALLLVCASMLMSQSRGGFIAFCTAGILFGFMAYFWINPNTSHQKLPLYRRPLLALSLALVIVSCFGLYHGLNRVLSRFDKIEQELGPYGRYEICKYTFKMATDFWQTGIGAGAYDTVVSRNYSGNWQVLINNAHNDYLELFAEYGFPFAIVWLAIAIFILIRLTRNILKRHDKIPAWCGLGVISIIIGNAVHEWTDYNVQAWPNAMFYSTLLGLAVVCSNHYQEDHSCHDTNERQKGRFSSRLYKLALAILMIFASMHFLSQISKGIAYQMFAMEFRRNIPDVLLGTADDTRRIAKANKAIQNTPFRTMVHSLRARTFWEASRRHGALNKERLADACTEITTVMSLAPCTPVDAMACARFHDDANRAGVRKDSPVIVFNLYKWAVQCQPGVKSTVAIAAKAAFNYYVLAQLSMPDEAANLKQAMLEILRTAMIVNPEDRELCHILLKMNATKAEIAHILPDTAASRLLLATCLKERRNWKMALEICQRFSHSELPPDATSKDITTKLKALLLEMDIYEILGRYDERAACWPLLEEHVNKLLMLKYEKAKNKDSVLQVLRNICWRSPLPHEAILAAATLETSYGEADQVPYFLLNLLNGDFDDAGKLPAETIVKARQLLPTKISLDPPTKFRTDVLINAFNVMQAENVPDILKNKANAEYLLNSANALEALGDHAVSQDGDSLWGQSHLAYIFAARAFLLLKDKESAARNCRNALRDSPNNWYALQILKVADSSKMTAAEAHVFNVMRSRKDPIARFSNGLRLAAAESVPFVITKKQPEQTVTLYYYLDRELRFAIKGSLEYNESNGTHMFKTGTTFPPAGTTMFSWRIGEIHTLETHNSLWVSQNRLFRKGRFFMKMNYQNTGKYELNVYPSPFFCIGNVKE